MALRDTIDDLAGARDSAMRVTARALINAYHSDKRNNIEDFIQILGEELSKHATDYAVRTGDYDRASLLNIIADHLMKLDSAIEN